MSGQVISAVNLTNGNKHSIGLPYGVCSTAKDTAAKTVTVNGGDGFVLEAGAMVVVKFTNANSIASPTLNVNGTGAKSICRYGTTKASTGTTTTGWVAGAVQTFVYDGTNWIREYWNNTTYSNASLGQGYATQNNTAQAAAITATLGSYSLTAGGVIAFKANYNVLANSTLNINGKGAKPIWFRGLAIANNIIRAGDVATLIYDGTNYHLLAIDRWQNDITNLQSALDRKSEILVVNITGDEANGYSANKTFSEIATAFSQNNMVYCDFFDYMELPILFPIVMLSLDMGMAIFYFSFGDIGLIVTITSDNEVTVEEFDYVFSDQLDAELSTKVPTSRTVNGKALSSNITLSASDVGAYAKSEVDTKLSGKANSSHGNHVPATETANNAKFLRNDNTWQTVTPANIGAAASSHNHAASNITSGTLSSDRLPVVPVAKGGTGATTAAGALTNLGITAAAAELNYCDGVTSNIQTQLNTKLTSTDASSTYMTKSNPTGSGTLTMDGDGDFSGAVSVESLQIGGVTVNHDATNGFLEFIFTSTTDTGTEG